jgi:hypothetical protein
MCHEHNFEIKPGGKIVRFGTSAIVYRPGLDGELFMGLIKSVKYGTSSRELI